jgi:hypothetical protein
MVNDFICRSTTRFSLTGSLRRGGLGDGMIHTQAVGNSAKAKRPRMLRLWRKRLIFYLKQSTGSGRETGQIDYRISIAKK